MDRPEELVQAADADLYAGKTGRQAPRATRR
jgi:hypothetical protein